MAEKKAQAGKLITIEQYRGAARRPQVQIDTLKGLGLNKIRRRRTIVDTPSSRGMVNAVRHLVRIVDEKA